MLNNSWFVLVVHVCNDDIHLMRWWIFIASNTTHAHINGCCYFSDLHFSCIHIIFFLLYLIPADVTMCVNDRAIVVDAFRCIGFFFLTESAVLLNVAMSPQTEIILHSIVIPFIFHLSRKNRWKKKQQLRHANRNKSTGIIIYGEIASFDHFFSTFTHS